MTRDDLRLFPEETQEEAIEMIRERLPDDAKLLHLAYTGGRAFGWGPENTDIDLRGFYVLDDWFTKCHIANNPFDGTIRNVYDVDNPDLFWQRWNMYYDWSKAFYLHDDWDYDEFMSRCSPSRIQHAYPHNIDMQISRMEKNFQARSCCHSYKEILIPLHYLRTGEIEINITKLLDGVDYGVEHFEDCRDTYMENLSTRTGLERRPIVEEVHRLFEELGEELENRTDYEHEPRYDDF